MNQIIYLKNKTTKEIIPTITKNNIVCSINLSPHLNFKLEKGNNYKTRNINYNYIEISESSQRNFSFSNTNKNLIDYSLNNICFMGVEE